MKYSLTLFLFLTLTSSYSQEIKEHSCPENSKFQRQESDDEIICMCIHDTLLNGKTFIYDKKGKLKEENEWAMGAKTGMWKVWNNKGKLIYETEYRNGLKNGTEIYYFDNGNRKVLTTYVNDVRNGRVAEWFENGNQNTEGILEGETQKGTWVFRMPDNKTVAVVKFKDGKEESSKYVKWTKADFLLTELEQK